MKPLKSFIGTGALGMTILFGVSLMLSGCVAMSYNTASVGMNDLYGVHDKKAIAEEETRKAEIARAQAEAREARLRAMIAEANADQAQLEYDRTSGNPYQDILVDDYESAYERRLRGFESPTYRMPSSYYNFRYGDSYFYATAYDPAFYNIMIMGDQVWVEPKYITAMFGSWGSPSFSFSFGWGSPFWSAYAGSYWAWRNAAWGYPYWGWGYPYWGNPYYWGWGSSWHFGWGWNYPYWSWGGYWHRPHYGWYGGGGYHRNPYVNYRPNYQSYGNNRTTYRTPYGYNNRSGVTTNNRNSSSYRNRNDNTTYRYDRSNTSRSDYSRPSYNNNNNSSSYNRGGGSYSSGSSYNRSSGGSSGGGTSRGSSAGSRNR